MNVYVRQRTKTYEEKFAQAKPIIIPKCFFCGRVATWMTPVPGWWDILHTKWKLPKEIPTCVICREQAFEWAVKAVRNLWAYNGKREQAHDQYYVSREAGERAMAYWMGC